MNLQQLTDGTVLNFDTNTIYSAHGTNEMGVRILPGNTNIFIPDVALANFTALQNAAAASPAV